MTRLERYIQLCHDDCKTRPDILEQICWNTAHPVQTLQDCSSLLRFVCLVCFQPESKPNTTNFTAAAIPNSPVIGNDKGVSKATLKVLQGAENVAAAGRLTAASRRSSSGQKASTASFPMFIERLIFLNNCMVAGVVVQTLFWKVIHLIHQENLVSCSRSACWLESPGTID